VIFEKTDALANTERQILYALRPKSERTAIFDQQT
jgi:hypothetical protein